MVEAIVVIMLMAVMAAIAIPAVSAQMASLKLKELDHNAKQIYLAAQNQIFSARGAGIYSDLVGDASLPDVSLTDGSGLVHSYRFLSSSLAAAGNAEVQRLEKEFLPNGSVDHTISGQYAIIFDGGSGLIRGVLYRESALDTANIPLWMESPSLRTQDVVGYYGDDSLIIPDLKRLPAPIVEVENGDKLLLKVRLPAPWDAMARHLQLHLSVVDANRPGGGNDFLVNMDFKEGYGPNMAYFDDIDKSDLRNITYIKVLDGGGRSAASVFPSSINRGADILITANLIPKPDDPPPGSTHYSPSVSVSQRVNMFFQSIEVQAGIPHIQVSSARHLYNLGQLTSEKAIREMVPGIADPHYYVEQVDDIDINAAFNPRSTPFLRSYDGHGLEIRGYRIQSGINNCAGLFTEIGDKEDKRLRCSLTNINLVQCSIGIGGVSNIGYLVGRAWNTDIVNCHVYPAPGEAPHTQSLSLQNTYVGGLVGRAQDCTITDSSATFGDMVLNYDATAYGAYGVGGLVGMVEGHSSISRSYSYATRLQVGAASASGNKSAGMLVGVASGSAEISTSFAVGNLAADVGNVGGLVGNAGPSSYIHDCYSLVSFSVFVIPSAIAGGSADVVGGDTYYVLSLSGSDVADPGGAIPLDDTDAMVNAGNSAWQFASSSPRSAVNTRPVGYGNSGAVYPYPLPRVGTSEYIYHGNWP